MISIIIPAYNEASVIGGCLTHLLASDPVPGPPVQVIVVANGCRDDTADRARGLSGAFADKGWEFSVLDLPKGSKPGALNAGDGEARYDMRAYIDADIHVTPGLVAALAQTLNRPEPTYAGGLPKIRTKGGWFSRRYSRFWKNLPFMADGVPGCGVYAVNAAARARWSDFPDIVSDDTFVRRHFKPEERIRVGYSYTWPITEGFPSLVRVRRRQDMGLAELEREFPDLVALSDTTTPGAMAKGKLFVKDPIGFVFYASVAFAVRLPVFRNRTRWERRK